VALGNISHPDRVVSGQHLIQFTAAISPGSSGGGLFVQNGSVVGITAYSRRNPEDQNLNFAVPIDVIRAAIDKEATIAKGSPSYYYVQGNLAGDRRAWDTAVRHYSRAIALNPRYAEAYAGRANAHFELRQYMRELDDYSKASTLAPTDPVIALYLGNAYDDVGRYRDAIAAYKRTLALKPDYPFALQALLLDYLAVGDHSDAAALLPKLSAVDPGLGQQMTLIVDKVK
jgi:tetratricopeptide (TPR) repeat protein